MKFISYQIIFLFSIGLCNAASKPPSFYELNNASMDWIYTPSSPPMYVLGSTTILITGCLIATGLLYIMPPSLTHWDKDEWKPSALKENWMSNVRSGPVVDEDGIFLNWITHPYWGAVYYMQPRSVGYSFAESALFSFVASSFFWEYGIEAFAEDPSWQDLIITPAIGSLIGEVFYRSTKYIMNNGNLLFGSRVLANIALVIMDPLKVAMQDWGIDRLFGIKNQTSGIIQPNMHGGVSMAFIMRF